MTASHSAAPHSQRRARGVSQPVATWKESAASATPAEPTTSCLSVRVVAVSRFDEAGIRTQLARPPRVTFRDAGPASYGFTPETPRLDLRYSLEGRQAPWQPRGRLAG